MADITLEIRRIPRPGKRFEVVQSVITAIKNTGRMGVVTGSVMTPHTGDQDVVSALLFSSWDELEKMHSIAQQIASLVLQYGGSLSGEHGDGILRGVFTEKMFVCVFFINSSFKICAVS